MLSIKQKLDNDDHYVGSNNIKYIVIHDTGNSTDSDESNANYFCSGTRHSSAHYFVDDDSITQLVLDRDGAWHCGDGANRYGINNRNSIGIEMCRRNNTVTKTTENNTLELVRQKMIQYNIPIDRVVRHYDASRKNCPASFSDNNWERWTNFKNKLISLPLNGWQKLQGNWYYFVNGKMAVNSWAKDYYGDWFYLGYNGIMVTKGWAQDSSKDWFYLDSDGRIVKNQWVFYTPQGTTVEKQYYMSSSGVMLKSCKTPDGYTVLEDGSWDGKEKTNAS